MRNLRPRNSTGTTSKVTASTSSASAATADATTAAATASASAGGDTTKANVINLSDLDDEDFPDSPEAPESDSSDVEFVPSKEKKRLAKRRSSSTAAGAATATTAASSSTNAPAAVTESSPETDDDTEDDASSDSTFSEDASGPSTSSASVKKKKKKTTKKTTTKTKKKIPDVDLVATVNNARASLSSKLRFLAPKPGGPGTVQPNVIHPSIPIPYPNLATPAKSRVLVITQNRNSSPNASNIVKFTMFPSSGTMPSAATLNTINSLVRSQQYRSVIPIAYKAPSAYPPPDPDSPRLQAIPSKTYTRRKEPKQTLGAQAQSSSYNQEAVVFNTTPTGKDSTQLENQLEYMEPDGKVKTLNLKCKRCKLVFHLRSSYHDHLLFDHMVKPYKCLHRECPDAFEEESELQHHIENDHPDDTAWKCSKCPCGFTHYHFLANHFALYHEPGHFQCIFCSMTSTTRAPVQKHHLKDHSFECDVCKRAFPSINDLKAHRKGHQTTSSSSTFTQQATIAPVFPLPTPPPPPQVIEQPLPQPPDDEPNLDDEAFCDPSALLDVKLKEENLDEEVQVINFPAKKKRKLENGQEVVEGEGAGESGGGQQPTAQATQAAQAALAKQIQLLQSQPSTSNGKTGAGAQAPKAFIMVTQPNVNGQVFALPINQALTTGMCQNGLPKNVRLVVVPKAGSSSSSGQQPVGIAAAAAAASSSSSGGGGGTSATGTSSGGAGGSTAVPQKTLVMITHPTTTTTNGMTKAGTSSSTSASTSTTTTTTTPPPPAVVSSMPIVNSDDDTDLKEATYYRTIKMRCLIRCASDFETKKKLVEHMDQMHCILPYRCQHRTCGRSFGDKINLSRHLAHHTSGSNANFTFKCSYCTQAFTEHRHLATHVYLLHDMGEFACTYPECTYQGLSRGIIADHYRADHLFECAYSSCKSSFESLGELKDHERKHTGFKRFYCKWKEEGVACKFEAKDVEAVVEHVVTKDHRPNKEADPERSVGAKTGFHSKTLQFFEIV